MEPHPLNVRKSDLLAPEKLPVQMRWISIAAPHVLFDTGHGGAKSCVHAVRPVKVKYTVIGMPGVAVPLTIKKSDRPSPLKSAIFTLSRSPMAVIDPTNAGGPGMAGWKVPSGLDK